jgi:prepilin peptidase CpaA
MSCGFSSTFGDLAFLAAFVALTGYAALTDIRGFRIPNAVSVALIMLFLARYALIMPPISLNAHLAVAGATFVILFAFYIFGWFGAGDAKLITALMLWAGPEAAPSFAVAMALSGGLFALLLIILGKAVQARPRLAGYVPSSRVLRWAERGVCPYGVPIFAAALFAAPLILGAACNPA